MSLENFGRTLGGEPEAFDDRHSANTPLTLTAATNILTAGPGTGAVHAAIGLGATIVTPHTLHALGLAGAPIQLDKLQAGLGDLFVASQMDGGKATAMVNHIAASNPYLNMYMSAPDAHGQSHAMVAIDFVAANGNGAHLEHKLEAYGLQHGSSFGTMAGGFLPADALGQVSGLHALAFARPVMAITNTGSVESQDVLAMNVDTAHTTYGLTGAGITIGILSDSFNANGFALTDYNADVASGDLPAGINVLEEDNTGFGRDEGRAMAQLAYDIAPGAAFQFHTADISEADFANGIVALGATSNIVVDDITYLTEPFFQDGIIAQAVDTATGEGAMYFSASGNFASESYESVFRNSGQTYNYNGTDYTLHDFDPGAGVDTRQRIDQDPFNSYVLQWDQPFKSVTGTVGATSDLALFIFNTSGDLVAVADDSNIGNDPLEILDLFDPGTFDIAIGVKDGSADPGLIKYVAFGKETPQEYDTASATTFGHANAATVNSVAAAYWYSTDRFGGGAIPGDPFPYAETFTSKGGVPILFDIDGNRLTSPEFRDSIKFAASDKSNNTFFGRDDPNDPDDLPNFSGTSAAAPNAAAVAALLMEKFPTATSAQIVLALQNSAQDIQYNTAGGATGVGYDATTGTGLIDANAAVAALHALLPPVAVADAFQTDEMNAVSGNLLADNGSGADFYPGGYTGFHIAKVNGHAAKVGTATPVTLRSGALITVNADGTFHYDPNHMFDYLPDAASGAPSTVTDTFTYTLTGGGKTTVSVFVHGVDSDDTLKGTHGSDTYNGGTGNDILLMKDGGADTVSGSFGNDQFYFGGALTASDTIDGGTGMDWVRLEGDYFSGLTFTDSTMVGVERLSMHGEFDYKLTMADGNVAAGDVLRVGDTDRAYRLTFDGSAETDGSFVIIGRSGGNTITGGARDDVIRGGVGGDFLTGGGGADRLYGNGGPNTFVLNAVADSTSTTHDRIFGFNANREGFQLNGFTVGAVDDAVTGGRLSVHFDDDLAHAIDATKLAAGDAVLFTPDHGSLGGHTFLVIDANGIAGYQAQQDFVIELSGATNLDVLSSSNFI